MFECLRLILGKYSNIRPNTERHRKDIETFYITLSLGTDDPGTHKSALATNPPCLLRRGRIFGCSNICRDFLECQIFESDVNIWHSFSASCDLLQRLICG